MLKKNYLKFSKMYKKKRVNRVKHDIKKIKKYFSSTYKRIVL